MNTKDDFNSKKIMEDIDGLENDTKSKKVSRKFKFLNFIESLIFIVLMGIVAFVVLYSCMVAIFEEFEIDYASEDYIYDDYSYDYYTNNQYSNYKNQNTHTNENANANLTTNITLEEFLKSDEGNKVLKNTIQTNSVTNENILEEDISLEEVSVEDTILQEENQETIEKINEELNQSIEEQRKNLIINEEGKSINDKIIISIENKNVDLVFDLVVYAVFYKEDKIVAVDEQEVSIILKDGKRYLKIENTPEIYDRYDIFITKFETTDFGDSILNEDVILLPYSGNGNIKVKVMNESNKKINRLEMTIIYYDSNGNILDIEDAVEYNIWKSVNGATVGYGVWDDDKGIYVNHDTYKVIFDAAIHYE